MTEIELQFHDITLVILEIFAIDKCDKSDKLQKLLVFESNLDEVVFDENYCINQGLFNTSQNCIASKWFSSTSSWTKKIIKVKKAPERLYCEALIRRPGAAVSYHKNAEFPQCRDSVTHLSSGRPDFTFLHIFKQRFT